MIRNLVLAFASNYPFEFDFELKLFETWDAGIEVLLHMKALFSRELFVEKEVHQTQRVDTFGASPFAGIDVNHRAHPWFRNQRSVNSLFRTIAHQSSFTAKFNQRLL